VRRSFGSVVIDRSFVSSFVGGWLVSRGSQSVGQCGWSVSVGGWAHSVADTRLVEVTRRLLIPVAGLVLAGLLAGCSTGPTNVVFTLGTADRDLTYCNSQTLDLYIPHVAGTRPVPLAIYVHGGGMTAGDKSDISPIFLDALASAGYVVASVNYRLAPESKFPAQIEDVKCAIRYLRNHAPMYRVNGNEIFAFGTSVGGQLVALAALTGPHSVFDVGPYPTEPSTLLAAADMFGPANLSEGASGFSPSGIQQVFGNSDHRDLVLASPTHFVVPNSPPILLVQGVDDTKVLKSQSMELYRDLKGAGDQTQLVLVQNMGHMFMQVGSRPLDPGLRLIGQDMVRYFDNAQNM
jgi:acetyl esterase/lipase